jgi:hypothetical protein
VSLALVDLTEGAWFQLIQNIPDFTCLRDMTLSMDTLHPYHRDTRTVVHEAAIQYVAYGI